MTVENASKIRNMTVEIVDKTGTLRDTEEFTKALAVFTKRVVTGAWITTDPELWVMAPVIYDALKLAADLSRFERERRAR